MQPGETITPGSSPAPEQQPDKTEAPVAAPVEQTSLPPIPAPESPQVQETEASGDWQFTDDSEPMADGAAFTPQINPVSWTASEYVAHNKGSSWFIAFGLMLFVAVVGVYFVTHDFVAPVVIAVAGMAFGIFAGRPPRTLEYNVDTTGIHIGPKFYPYAEFKSFDISEEGSLPTILLTPLKRFLPPITLFYDQNQEDAILNVISSYLPHQEQQTDLVDRFTRRIRF